MVRPTWLLVIAVAGCIDSQLVPCGDKACPESTACDVVHATCVAPDQLTACDQLSDGAVCMAAGRAGICDRGTCMPGCGDGEQDRGEECDDGNAIAHDGCSQTCAIEKPTWGAWQNVWTPRD